MEQPVYYWDPSIAPSGMIFYTGDAFPDWRGDLFVGSLKFGYLVRLDIDGGKIVDEERLTSISASATCARSPTATCICSPTRTRGRSSSHAGIEVLTISDG
jgi:Glucose / Sorbosone dehydrogenase